MTRRLGLIVCGALVVGGTLVHGAATHRWALFSPPPERSAQTHAYVVKVHDYTHEDVPSELPVKERSLVTSRRYTSPSRGQTIIVSLTSGPPGAVATHTPDVCYTGSGFKTIREPKMETIELPGGGTATCWMAEYEKRTATSVDRHRIRWAWSIDGRWEVPRSQRWAYFGESELFKLYVVIPLSESDAEHEQDNPAATAFIAQVFQQYSERLRRP